VIAGRRQIPTSSRLEIFVTNFVKGEVAFEADGAKYTLVLNVNALCALEAQFPDQDAQATVNSLLDAKKPPKVTAVRAVFWAALQEFHPDLTLIDTGRLMTTVTAGAARALIVNSVLAAWPTKEDGKAEASPRKEAAPGTGPASTDGGAPSA